MFEFHFNVHADLSALENQVSELISKVDEVKALLAAESEQSAALVAKVDDLKAKLDALASDTFPKSEVFAALDEIKSLVPGVVPDAPAE